MAVTRNGAVTSARIEVSVEGTERSQADMMRLVREFDRGFKAAERQAARVGKEFDHSIKQSVATYSAAAKGLDLKSLVVKVDVAFKGLRNTLTEVNSGISILQRAGAAAVGVFNAIVSKPATLAIDFERAISAIKTLGPLPAGFEQQILDLARRVPQAAGDIAKAAYDAISSGIAQADVPRFLESASRAAVGGQVDLATATATLTSALNAFQSQGLSSARAADILFQTMNKGVIVFSDFEKFQGKTLATAANLGVSFEELNAAVATLTLKGVRPEAAYDRINAALVALSATTKQAKDGAKRYNVETGVSALQAKGLTGVLDSLSRATGGSAAAIVNLTDRQEAQQALTILLGEGMKTYKDNLDAIQGSAGATGKAFDIMSADTKGLIDLFKAELEGLLIQVGKQLLPSLREALLRLREALSGERGQAIVTTLATIGRGVIFLAKALADAAVRAADFVAKLPAFAGVAKIQQILSEAAGGARSVARDLGVMGGAYDDIVARSAKLKVSLTTTIKLIALQGQVTQAASAFSKVAEGGVFNAVELAKAAQTLATAGQQLQQAFSVAEQEDVAFRQARSRQLALEQAAAEKALDDAKAAAEKAKNAAAEGARERAADLKKIAENAARVDLELIEDSTERQIIELTQRYQAEIALAQKYGADTTFLERRLQQSIEDIRIDSLAGGVQRRLEILRDERRQQQELERATASDVERLLQLRTDAIPDPVDRAVSQRQLQADAEVAQIWSTFQNAQLAAQAEVVVRRQAEQEIMAIRKESTQDQIDTLKRGLDSVQESTSGLLGALGVLFGASQAFRKAQLIADGFFYAVKAAGLAAEAGAAFGTGNVPGGLQLTVAAFQAAAASKLAFSSAARLKGPGGGGGGTSAGGGRGVGVVPQARTRADFGPNRATGGTGAVTINVVMPVGDGGFLTRQDADEGGRRIANVTRRHLAGAAR